MATTFKNMQDDVLDLCQELQSQPDFTLTRVKRMINRGIQNFVKDSDCIMDVLSFTTVANQVFYTSSDVGNFAYAYKVLSVKYITDASQEHGKVLHPYPGGHTQLPRNKSFGEPSYYYVRGLDNNVQKKLGTYPIVDVSSETLEVQVYRYPTADLSSDGSTPEIPDTYRDAPVYYAVWRLSHAYSHKSPGFRAKAIEHKQLYESLVNEFRGQNFETDLGGTQVTDVYADF